MTPQEERRLLVERMRDFFEGKSPDPELDEYELVDAYDYAGDRGEFDLQFMISEYAIKRFPDFDPLRMRHAQILLDKGERYMAETVAARVNPDMLLRELFFISLKLYDGEPSDTFLDELEALLDKHSHFSDEDIIRFSDLAMDLEGGYEWLKAHMDKLRSKNSFLPTLLFEMAQNAREVSNEDDAIAFVEELTMIEPFEVEYWELLAEIHIAREDYDKASQALEYSLAIDSHASRSRLLQAHLRVLKGDPVENVVKDLEDLVFPDNEDASALPVAVSELNSRNKGDLALEYILKFLKKFPGNMGALDLLLRQAPALPETESLIRDYWTDCDDRTYRFWSSWALHHYANANYRGAVTIYKVFLEHSKIKLPLYYLLSLYYSNLHGEVTKYVVDNGVPENDESSHENQRQMVTLVFIMSLVRTNNEEPALKIIEAELSTYTRDMINANLPVNIAIYGYGAVLKYIRKNIVLGVYPDAYDPLLMPNNLD